MTEIFYEKKENNKLDNLKVDVKELFEKYPANLKINPKQNQVDFLNSYFYKIYRNSLIPLKVRSILWKLFRQISLDNNYLEEFNKYWIGILKARPLPTVHDLFFIKNIYRLKFQYNVVPDTTDPYTHLEAWQRPEIIYQLLALICKPNRYFECDILKLMNKNKKKVKSFLEFGCATAPITTAFYEFFKKPKDIKIFISDLQTLAFHYACFTYRKCSNVIPLPLTPDNDFLPKLQENVDVIFCLAVFEHLNKPLDIIKIFHNTLNNKGLLIFDYEKTYGGGLNTNHGLREREQVLDYIYENFKLIYGRISKDKDMGLTIIKKT